MEKLEKQKKIVIVQRFYYNFREGFFEYLEDNNINFCLINSTKSRGKVKVHAEAAKKSFIKKVYCFYISNCYVVFPFLFFRLISLNPGIVISEGGQNTINNVQIMLYSRLFRKKYIIWDLGKGYAEFGNSFFRRIYMKIYVSILKHARYIFGYNSQSKDYFISLGIDGQKIIVLNNTIDTRKIRDLKKAYVPYIPQELSASVDKGYIFLIFVGTLVASKNIEDLSDLMKMLGERYFLIIVGDGKPDYVSSLQNRFEGTNHAFVGYKRNEQLLPYYDLASFAVLPGLGGLSINQAMAFGVPVVCRSADGAEKDLVLNDTTGYIYSDLTDASEYILSKDKASWDAMGIRAGEFLFSEHSVEKMMDTFLEYSLRS